MKVLLDNGHGDPPITGGKQSPDGKLKEYYWAREITSRLLVELRAKGIDADRIVPEKEDISLKERVKRVNDICSKFGSNNVVLISVHVNASASYGWHLGSGFSVFVSKNASNSSKNLAKIFTENAESAKLLGNRYVPKEKYWVGNYAIVRDTKCPAVITENMFMDNTKDCEFLLSEKGKKAIVKLHVKSILEYIKSK